MRKRKKYDVHVVFCDAQTQPGKREDGYHDLAPCPAGSMVSSQGFPRGLP